MQRESGRFETRDNLERFMFTQWAAGTQSIDVVAKSAGVHKAVAIQILNDKKDTAEKVYDLYSSALDLLDRLQNAPHNRLNKNLLVAETVHELKEILSTTRFSKEVLEKHGLPHQIDFLNLSDYVEKEIDESQVLESNLSVFRS